MLDVLSAKGEPLLQRRGVWVLSKNGAIDLYEYVTTLQQTTAEHRQLGDPNNRANAIHAISIHIQSLAPARLNGLQKSRPNDVIVRAMCA
jgi:hypothetical protein